MNYSILELVAVFVLYGLCALAPSQFDQRSTEKDGEILSAEYDLEK